MEQVAAASAAAGHSRVIGKIAWRLMPFLVLLYVVNYIDRTNVAMAKLQLVRDVELSEAAYGLGAGLFFIGYFFFEFPSNLILERVGARRWIARIMVSWGIVSAAMMFVKGVWSFYALRFLLGVTEAGFFPGIILYLTYWVPARYRASMIAAFMTSTTFSGMIGNPLAGLLMRMDGIGGLHGWQWLFLIEGLIPVGLGVVVWFVLPDRPGDARWLTEEDKAWIEGELRAEGAHRSAHDVRELGAALRSGRLWLLAGIYFMVIMGLYGLTFWAPTLIKGQAAGMSDLGVGFLSAVPYLVGAVAMVLIGRHSDRTGERRMHAVTTFLIAAAGMALVSLGTSAAVVTGFLCVAALGVFSTFGPFWAMATRFLRGTAAAGGIAIVNSIGNLAGFLAPFALGYAKTNFGSFVPGLLFVAGTLVCGAVLVMCMPKTVDDPPAAAAG